MVERGEVSFELRVKLRKSDGR